VAVKVREFLVERGIVSVLAFSGNGYHVLVPLAIPKTDTSIRLVKKITGAFNRRFGSTSVKIDPAVANAARMIKPYGTVAQKGPNTTERPHRLSGIVDAPNITTRLDQAALQALMQDVICTLPAEEQDRIAVPENERAARLTDSEVEKSLRKLKAKLKEWNWEWTRQQVSSDGELIMLFIESPWKKLHSVESPESVWVGVNRRGEWCFDSQHGSDSDKSFRDFREAVDPYWNDFNSPSYVQHKSGEFWCGPEMILENGTLVSESPVIIDYKDNYLNFALFGGELVLEKPITLNEGLESVLVVNRNNVSCTTVKRECNGLEIKETVGNDDWGLAVRWLKEEGANHRYCASTNTWMYFNGRVWCEDNGLNAHKSLKRVIRKLAATAKEKNESKFLSKVQTNSRQMAVISTARFEEGVSVSQAAFDRGDYFLNVLNGTLRFDRNTGAAVFGSHSRLDYAKKLAPLTYDPTAKCPAFDTWFEWFQPDAAVRAFLLQYFGLALIGLVPRAFLVLLGPGGNGKGTLMSTLCQMLGDVIGATGEIEGSAYSWQPDMVTFTSGVELSPSGHRADLVPFMGARLISAAETSSSTSTHRVKLNTDFLKRWTGGVGESISVRGVYDKKMMTFKPSGLLVFQTNSAPDIGDDSDGMWERMKLVMCNSKISKQDTRLVEKLVAESSGILNRLISGLQEYVKAGRLETPASVENPTKQYRTEDSPIRGFIEDELDIVSDPSVSTPVSEVFERYEEWFKINQGQYPPKQKEFTNQLKAALGINGVLPRGHGGRRFQGVSLKREENSVEFGKVNR
jgi:P4 family phage/plasmid primase-like protien